MNESKYKMVAVYGWHWCDWVVVGWKKVTIEGGKDWDIYGVADIELTLLFDPVD